MTTPDRALLDIGTGGSLASAPRCAPRAAVHDTNARPLCTGTAERSHVWSSTRSKSTSEGGGRSLSRRELLAATGGVVLAGSLAGQRRLGLRGERGRSPSAAARSGSASPAAARRTSSTASRSRRSPTRRASPPAGRRCSATTATTSSAPTRSPRRPRRTTPSSGRSGSRAGSSSTTARRSSADDVIYSLRRIANPKNKLFGSAGIAAVDVEHVSRRWTSSPSACT